MLPGNRHGSQGHLFHESEDEITAAAYGPKSHICIHWYPHLAYAAVDIYSFNIDLKPARSMAVLRAALHPEKSGLLR